LYNIENVPNVKDPETKALLEELLDQQIIAPKGNRNLVFFSSKLYVKAY